MQNSAMNTEYPAISNREKACLAWTAKGKSSWAIGKTLSISEHTVNFHLRNAMRKLNCSSRMAAALKAVELGIIGWH
ncbi:MULTISPECIES: response regulator transcription factor [Rhizobium]|uniref:Transcriptional regulator, LuxR family n=3 Tax=Rhizobium/Agrobacterium group TaxID=227290 RepID=N6U8U8_9HYPH|nr:MULTISPECIES: helix-turn-helix transcriptional regulator [Rhizobium]AGB73358.1 transcriptional regulator, LuxR family [Rhizobium tropici CIAT 899]AYG76689.1 LuxR family transcriptional regulator [Rhizobium sp. CCGE532]ENN86663.1 transcriptional regulator, LuxR family [Rhizobium freirei PRF 81]TGE88929.1 LuxR family transcriptional regulator [Rhizobium sp. SEMIA 4088]NEV14962.1 helix-turn-helix transcriptional regulator [Rhizobium tropici]